MENAKKQAELDKKFMQLAINEAEKALKEEEAELAAKRQLCFQHDGKQQR